MNAASFDTAVRAAEVVPVGPASVATKIAGRNVCLVFEPFEPARPTIHEDAACTAVQTAIRDVCIRRSCSVHLT